MSHNPKREDYQRLGLRLARKLDEEPPSAAARAFASFGRQFAQNRDSLPQTDSDRAFHLVSLATELVDYKLPFATDAQADQIIRRGKDLLDEALSLDPLCFDALRMRSSTEAPNVEARYSYLSSMVGTVRSACEEERERAAGERDEERSVLAASLAMRPYWRWLASMAEEALICGRNHDAIAVAEQLLESDPHDLSDVRFTLAYALAKLEDEQGLEELARRYSSLGALRPPDDAWMLIARMALAHKRHDLPGARRELARLVDTYPHAAEALVRQVELPDGEFARLSVPPYSEDELTLAISEGIVLFQEGNERSGKGVFGAWVAREAALMDPEAAKARAEASPDRGGDAR